MANKKELRIQSKSILYDLLMLRHEIKNGNGEEFVEKLIDRAIAVMDCEDVAHAKAAFHDRLNM
jgi:hypothetical protein